MSLPESFLNNMKKLLGTDFPAFLNSYNEKPHKGLRTNSLKLSSEDFYRISPFPIKKIPYIRNGFFYDDESPARDAYYHAGLYYLQEPSAMLPAGRLPVNEGDKVLDLCAAPGGKATEILCKLNGTGLLYANDYSASRASALLKNLELTGGKNYYVTAETPERLAERFNSYFDKILCDVPCSGEGMFRKDTSLTLAYNEKSPEEYAELQLDILKSAYKMVKPGGYIMYSTCTFNTLENEENILKFLDLYEDLSCVDIEGYEGFCGGFLGLDKCVRVFPHKMSGEGHFLALIKKRVDEKVLSVDITNSVSNDMGVEYITHNSAADSRAASGDNCLKIGKSLFKLPDLEDNGYRKGLRYLRTGLYVGDEAKDKAGKPYISFSQSYAMTLSQDTEKTNDVFDNCLNLSHDDVRVNKYLKGETIFFNSDESVEKGYTLILVNGYALGFAKFDGSKLKNLYNPYWRMK